MIVGDPLTRSETDARAIPLSLFASMTRPRISALGACAALAGGVSVCAPAMTPAATSRASEAMATNEVRRTDNSQRRWSERVQIGERTYDAPSREFRLVDDTARAEDETPDLVLEPVSRIQRCVVSTLLATPRSDRVM